MQIALWLVAIYLTARIAYRLGRNNGHDEAQSHCDVSFVAKQHIIKSMMDNVLRDRGLGIATADKLTLSLSGEVFFEGSPLEAAERSQVVGGLIKHIETVYPDLAAE